MEAHITIDCSSFPGARTIRRCFRRSCLPRFGYKFSWNPKGVFDAAQTSAAYYEKGKRIEVPGKDLLKHFHITNIKGLGNFETYPNRDSKKYFDLFKLDENVSFYRGLLRYPGYCNSMFNLGKLGAFDNNKISDFSGLT